MKKIALIICVLVLSLSCGSQQNSATTTIPNPPAVPETTAPSPTFDANGNLVGISAKSNFLVAPFNDWFNFNYESYELNTEAIASLKPLLKNIKSICTIISLFMRYNSNRKIVNYFQVVGRNSLKV